MQCNFKWQIGTQSYVGVHKTTELSKNREWALAEKWVLAKEHIQFTLVSEIM